MDRVLILGFGVSGQGVAKLLQAQGKRWVAVDRKETAGASFDHPEFPLDGIELVILSPGVAPTHPIVQRAIAAGIEVIGEIEYAFRCMQNRCIGVTGTNGKTTVTLLTAHLLNQAGIAAKAVGNVGVPLSEALLTTAPEEILVIELSSFQLETLNSRKLQAAAYLNLTPDHLDRYADLRAYAAAKAGIQRCVVEDGRCFVSDEVLTEYSDLFLPAPLERLPKAPLLLDLEAIRRGVPEPENGEAAFLLASLFGVKDREIKGFQKPPHRIEWVAEIDEVIYLDDSKGTNIDAVVYALKRLPGPIVLLAGGVDKGASYAPWIKAFEGKVRHLVAYGQAAAKMELELKDFVPFERTEKFADAVTLAKAAVRKGEIVLFSPGCSSFDQFQNYAERGKAFQKMIRGD